MIVTMQEFSDPTGMWIVGTNGKRVEYNSDTGKWINATNDVRRIGNAMMKTSIGTDVFNQMMESSYPIKLYFGETSNNNAGKTLTTIKTTTFPTGKTKKSISSVKIILNNNTIQGYLKEDALYSGKGLTEEERTGAIATHEGVHATNPMANSQLNGGTDKARETAEELAGAAEQKYIDEILKNRNNEENQNSQSD